MRIGASNIKTPEELKAFYEEWVFYGRYDNELNRRGKRIIEGYFIYGTISEERFLEYCDAVDSQLYDDYKDMYESEPYYFEIQDYVQDMQSVTGKIPLTPRKWNYLHLKTGEEGQRR